MTSYDVIFLLYNNTHQPKTLTMSAFIPEFHALCFNLDSFILELSQEEKDQNLSGQKLSLVIQGRFEREFGFTIEKIQPEILQHAYHKLRKMKHSGGNVYTETIKILTNPSLTKKTTHCIINPAQMPVFNFLDLFYNEMISSAKWANVRRLLLDPQLMMLKDEFSPAHNQVPAEKIDINCEQLSHTKSIENRKMKKAKEIYKNLLKHMVAHNLGIYYFDWRAYRDLDCDDKWIWKFSWEKLDQETVNFFLKVAENAKPYVQPSRRRHPFYYTEQSKFLISIIDSRATFFELFRRIEKPYQKLFHSLCITKKNTQHFTFDDITYFIDSENYEDPTDIYDKALPYSRELLKINMV